MYAAFTPMLFNFRTHQGELTEILVLICFFRWKKHTVYTIASGLDSGPLVLFNKLGTSSVIISPFSQFMAMSAVYEMREQDTTVSWGIMGAAKRIPKDFHCWTSLTYSSEGVNNVSAAMSLSNATLVLEL